MDYLVYVTLALGVIATVFFLYVRVKHGGVKGVLTKTLASVFFILTAVFSFIAKKEVVSVEFGSLVIMGLVFGLIGDIVLDLKVVYPADGDIYLFSGMASFALGHICYLTAIYLEVAKIISIEANLIVLLVPMAIAVVFALLAVLGGPLMKLKYGKFTAPSLIYAFLLAFMMCATGAALIVTKGLNPLWIIMFIGAVMFVVSDLILSQQYFFVVKKTNENGEVGYHDTYEYSWPAILQRLTGTEYTNFSRGGMSFKEFYESWADKNNFW